MKRAYVFPCVVPLIVTLAVQHSTTLYLDCPYFGGHVGVAGETVSHIDNTGRL